MLSTQLLEKYSGQQCAVLALNDGGVVVGQQIAAQLNCVLTLLQSAEIVLPRENQALAGITSEGQMAYNHNLPDAEIAAMASENYSVIEQEKLKQMHEMHQMVGAGGTVRKDLLKNHNVIVVADGLKTGFAFDLAVEFLKPIAIEKLVAAVPLASVQAVDRLHIQADDLYCLDVISEYMETDHYYEAQDVPDHATVLKTVEQIIQNWH